MVMVTGDDPVQGVHLLKGYIVPTHVKDGIRHQPVDPRDVCVRCPMGEGKVGDSPEMAVSFIRQYR